MNELTTNQAATAGAISGAVLGTVLTFTILFYIIIVIATWRIFKKAGEPGWKSLIPIYNYYIMYKIVNLKGVFWLMLLAGIVLGLIMSGDGTAATLYMNDAEMAAFDWGAHPVSVVSLFIYTIITIVCEVIYAMRTSRAFGHGLGYTLGLIFLQPIFWLILGFGSSKYHKKAVAAPLFAGDKSKK